MHLLLHIYEIRHDNGHAHDRASPVFTSNDDIVIHQIIQTNLCLYITTSSLYIYIYKREKDTESVGVICIYGIAKVPTLTRRFSFFFFWV